MQKIASIIKEAKAEIERLRAENQELRAKLEENPIKKEASFENDENFFGIPVEDTDYSRKPKNSEEYFEMFFGKD